MARKPLVWVGKGLLALAGVLVLVIVSLLIFRPLISLELLRPVIERTLTADLGAAISIRDLRIRTSLWPTLFARDVTLAHAGPLGVMEVARADELEVQIAVLPLLRHRLSIERIGLVGLEVEVGPTIALLDSLAGKSNSETEWLLVAVRELEGIDLVTRYDDADGDRHELDLDSVKGQVSQTEPLGLEVVGNLDEVALLFGLEGPPVENLLKLPKALPLIATLQVGDLVAETQVAISESRILLSALAGSFDGSPFTGALNLKFSDDRPAFGGELNLTEIDLGRWLPDNESTPGSDLHESRSFELAHKTIPYGALEVADVALQFSIGRVVGLPLEIDDLSFDLDIEDGRAQLPAQFQLAGGSVHLNATMDPSRESDGVGIEATVIDFPLERLADLDPMFSPLEGRIGELHANATASGETVAELLTNLSAVLELSESSFRLDSADYERPFDVRIAQLSARRSPNQNLRVDLEGLLQQQPVRLHVACGNLIDIQEGKPWSIAIGLKSLGSELELDGTLTPTETLPIVDTTFRLSGSRLADLSTWLGISEEADLPFGIAGHYHFDVERGELTITRANLGRSSFSGHALHVLKPSEYIQAEIEIDLIAARELEILAKPLEDREITEEGLSLDLPILPKPLALPDTELHLTVDRILRKPKDIIDLTLDLNFRQGELEPSTLSFRAGTSQIDGSIELYWEADTPTIQIEVEGDQVDLADLIEIDKIIEGYTARAEHLELDLVARGSTLRQLLSLESDMGLRGDGISVSKPIEDSEKSFELYLDRLEAQGPRKEPFAAQAEGRINDLPIEVIFETSPEETFKIGDDLPFELTVISNDLKAQLRGQLEFPLDHKKLSLGFHVSAPSISSLNPILEAELPDVGPLEMKGSFISSQEGIRIALDELIAGHSDLRGELVVDMRGERPRIDADLKAETLQPSDFLPEEPIIGPANEMSTSDEIDPIKALSNMSALRQFDGVLSLQVDQINWGGITGGGGALKAQLENGLLTIGPLQLAQDQSKVDLQAELLIQDSGVIIDGGLRVDDFRYGPIIQALDPDAEGDGTITFDTALRSTGSTIEELLTSGSGHFDFTVYPNAVDTRLFDFWAAGLRSVLRVFNPNNESVLNCLTGQFSLGEGLLQADSLILDTSQIRARGKGEVELKDQTIRMRFRPRPKRRTFLSLATPVRVSGPLKDPNIRISAGGFAGTVFRVYAWAVTVFFEVFRTPLPTDGSDICVAPEPRLDTGPEM